MEQEASTEVKAVAAEEKSGGAQTLLRGLDILEAVSNGSLPLGALSEQLNLTRSTTHRLAGALVDRGFMTFRPREGYSLGPKVLELGWCAGQQVHVARVARPYIEELSWRTEDAVHLGILDNDRAFYLDKVEGRRRVSIGSRIGERQPIASTGLGKALILDLDEARWRELYASASDGRPNTAGLAVWLERMRTYAEGGYAFDLEENEDQIRCVAAPVRNAAGDIFAAVSVSSAAQYMDDARMRSLIPIVQAACEKISRELGWTPRAAPTTE